MSAMIEFNRLTIGLDREKLLSWTGDLLYVSGRAPELEVPYKGGISRVEWSHLTEPTAGLKIRLEVFGELEDPDWSLIGKLQVVFSIRTPDEVIRWKDLEAVEVSEVYLEDDSVIYLDENPVNLLRTINRVLAHQKTMLPQKVIRTLEFRLRELSYRLFNTDLIPRLLQNLHYRFTSREGHGLELVESTGSIHTEHFAQAHTAPSYIFLKIPTADLVYFLNHNLPSNLIVKGYELCFESIDVIGDNKLIVKAIEISNDWHISLNTSFSLRDNAIYPSIADIQVQGLDVVKKVLLGLFRSLLVAQIEKRPIFIAGIYQKMVKGMEVRYPFLTWMPGQHIQLDALSIGTQWTEAMIHFDSDQA